MTEGQSLAIEHLSKKFITSIMIQVLALTKKNKMLLMILLVRLHQLKKSKLMKITARTTIK